MSDLVPKQLPEHITAIPPDVTDPLELYAGTVRLLNQAYLCMLANGTADYALVPAEHRRWFEEFTNGGYLFSLVQWFQIGAAAEASAHGLHLADVALTPTCMLSVRIGVPLTVTRERDELHRAVDHLRALSIRIAAAEDLLDLAARPARAPTMLSIAPTAPPRPTRTPKSERKQQIVADVLRLYAQAVDWKEITKQINAKYRLRRPSTTYQRYRREHIAKTDKGGRANAD